MLLIQNLNLISFIDNKEIKLNLKNAPKEQSFLDIGKLIKEYFTKKSEELLMISKSSKNGSNQTFDCNMNLLSDDTETEEDNYRRINSNLRSKAPQNDNLKKQKPKAIKL